MNDDLQAKATEYLWAKLGRLLYDELTETLPGVPVLDERDVTQLGIELRAAFARAMPPSEPWRSGNDEASGEAADEFVVNMNRLARESAGRPLLLLFPA
jgi:hypothetical protein